MDTARIAHPAQEPTTQGDLRRAIQERTTRGMLTFNTGRVHRLEGTLWAVPSTRGGFHKVDLDAEICDCEDFWFYGSEHGVGCRHIYAAAIANASRRSGVKVRTITSLVAGDGFKAAAKRRSKTATCDGCDRRFPLRDLTELDEDGHDGLELARIGD